MNYKWNLNCAKTVGRSHLRVTPPLPCQDSVLYTSENGVNVIALSDGCGSSKISELGADITTKILCKLLSDKFDEYYLKGTNLIKKDIISNIIFAIKDFILNNPKVIADYGIMDPNHHKRFNINWNKNKNNDKIYPITLFDATIQFVAEKDGKIILGRLGDGIIASINKNNLSIVSIEDKIGVENNATWYPSTILLALENSRIDPWVHFDLQKIDEIDTDSMFLIVSDGLEEIIVGEDNLEKFLYADEIDTILKEPDLFSLIEKQYKPLKGIYDDLSIILMKCGNPKIDYITIREYDKTGKTISNNKTIKIDFETDEINKSNSNETSCLEGNIPPKYIEKLKKLILHEEKYNKIYNISSETYNLLLDNKEKNFDEILSSIENKIDVYDVLLCIKYWEKIDLFDIDEDNKTIKMR